MNIVDLRKVIKRPLITEKGTRLRDEQNKYLFEVAGSANKIQIKEAVEKLFNVRVVKVNVTWMPGKQKKMGRNVGYRPDWKKAIVTLAAGDKIDLFESV